MSNADIHEEFIRRAIEFTFNGSPLPLDDAIFLLHTGAFETWRERHGAANMPTVITDLIVGRPPMSTKHAQHLRACTCSILSENPKLKEFIWLLYRQCYDAHKKGGDKHDFLEPITIFNNGDRFSCKDEFFQILKERRGAQVLGWHHDNKKWMWMENDVLNGQWAAFKKLIKRGEGRVRAYNNFTDDVNDVEWFGLTFQTTDQQGELTCGQCLGSMQIFNRMVRGYVYWFTKEENRDAFFRYLNVVKVGMKVFIHDLKQKPEYNERTGIVKEKAPNGRYNVQLDRIERDHGQRVTLVVRQEKFSEVEPGVIRVAKQEKSSQVNPGNIKTERKLF
jgi:hypothetical protein